jgi:imidazolonepropionase-like amidohydrolase
VPAPVAAGTGDGELAVRARRVLDLETGSWREGVVVIVRQGRITELCREVPAGTEVVDLGERSLLPGLIDTHTHVFLQGNRTAEEYAFQILEEEPAHRVARAVRALGTALRHGFTCVRDLGTEGAGFGDVALRQAVAEGILEGPELLSAGPAIGARYSYPISGFRSDWEFPVGVAECDGVDGCRREVRRQVARGVDWIKVYASSGPGSHPTEDGYVDGPPPWTAEELRTIVAEAHSKGVPVAAHAMTVSGTDMAVEAGVDSIEHGSAITPGTAALMAERGVPLIPTLLALREPPHPSFENCLDAGVKVVFGTDVGAFRWEEINQAAEFSRLVDLGLSPLEAIRSATTRAAALLRREKELGQVAREFRADLVACPGDPLKAVKALEGVDFVMKAGRVVVRPAG